MSANSNEALAWFEDSKFSVLDSFFKKTPGAADFL
jgi:hypothetical protein